jgi:hypothetical protein
MGQRRIATARQELAERLGIAPFAHCRQALGGELPGRDLRLTIADELTEQIEAIGFVLLGQCVCRQELLATALAQQLAQEAQPVGLTQLSQLGSRCEPSRGRAVTALMAEVCVKAFIKSEL